MSTIVFIGLLLVIFLAIAGAMMSRMPGDSFSGPAPPLTDEERLLTENLRVHVGTLAETIGERSLWKYANLSAAAEYIEEQFKAAGLKVRSVSYELSGKEVRNIEAELSGTGKPGEIIVLGAHYDSLVGTVGANDNASGVATLLELARLCKTLETQRTVRFVAFVNEEPPHFKSEVMGSRVYARRARENGERIVAMFSLETLGYFTDEPLTQKFPLPLLRWFYPQEGNFLAFVGNFRYAALLRESLLLFRDRASIPSQGIVAPGWLVGVDWSDHWSFWQSGYPAIMVTDTALFRYPYYHTQRDTPDKINYEALTRVTTGLRHVVQRLARAPGKTNGP